ncbi:YARHG domain-containing protein [Carboxylicivirga marina]|uniref:YARHG domain-containing protein n=1 Tax=Carboxylicivirga marina TaxID=2800988 RepID=UPI00259152EA|nr:YARHG domain-containing protein [uncultured Carboxylicivirga sp.]
MKYFPLFLIVLIIGCNKTEKVITSEIKAPYTNEPIVLTKRFSESNLFLERLDLSELRLLRNEIYARKGYQFKSKDLSEHFSNFDWYDPKYNSTEIESYLTKIDSLNINEVQKAERKIKENEDKKRRRKEWFDSFTLLDLMNEIPDIIYLADEGFWNGFSDEEWTNFYHFRDNEEALLNKLKMNKPIAGKIKMNDSIYIIMYTSASDLESFTSFKLMNVNGSTIPESKLTSSSRSLDKNDSIFVYNEFVLEFGALFEAKNWQVKYKIDEAGNRIELEKNILGSYNYVLH